MTKFYSHSKINDKNETYGSKELKVHVNGVLENALFHLSSNLNLGYTDDEFEELIKIIVQFHDLGKYTSYFQNYLLKKKPIDQILKRHAQIGGLTAYNLLRNSDERKALISLYIIFLHHSRLIDITDIAGKFDYNFQRIIEEQKVDLQKSIKKIESDLEHKNLESLIGYPNEKEIRRGFKYWKIKSATIQDYFLINYLFSLLIEGDKLDASDTPFYKLQSIQPSAVDNRYGNLQNHNKKLNELTNNELRNYCRKVVISNLENPNILNQYIFTLTAPTGIGKTMTALDFAIKLKSKVENELGIKPRIIYALPFINIIEQALNEYKKILPKNIRILGHYQLADIFGNEDKKESSEDELEQYNQKIMALDTWQADIVITSFVQFFESLIGNRNKLLKKFNHFAHSIIILDEVQTLRLDQMPLLGATLFYLSKFLKTRIILMTATRPKIFELAEKEILSVENESVGAMELLTNYEEVFSLFERTAIYPLLDALEDDKEQRTKEFINKIFSKKWSTEKSCLIVCNTVNQSIDLFSEISLFLEENELTNPIHYLSTNVIPAHRMNKIEQINNEIKSKKSPLLIATQVVEAGVDLDFDMGFRDVGPIDSIIQVAGRINRNNDSTRRFSPLYIVDFNSSATQRVYGRLSYTQTQKSLKKQSIFKETEYLKLVTQYFDDIADKSSFASSRKFFESMKSLKYDSELPERDYPVSAFRIIEQSDRYRPVFIEIDENAQKARQKYLDKIVSNITKEEFDKCWKLIFQQHIISVPKYLCDELETINEYEDNILVVEFDNIKTKYDANTGYIRDKQDSNSTLTF